MTRNPVKEVVNAALAKVSHEKVTIQAPDLRVATFTITGTAPYVQNAFPAKAQQQIKETQEAGQQSRSKKTRTPKDFNAAYEGAIHRTEEGKYGIPASSFRCAMISACRLIGFKMTLAKLSVFVIADGFDVNDGSPLVLIKGEPEIHECMVRLPNGSPDVRVRPMWRKWKADVRIRYDGDQFSVKDVSNLLSRVGMQVGIGEGRPDSKNSAGVGWGTFALDS